MRILIVSATASEIMPLRAIHESEKKTLINKHSLSFLFTGVGMVQTTYTLTKELQKNKYDFVINAGIAGSFYRGIMVGEVVQVISDCMIELGAENDLEFIKFPDLGMPGGYSFSNSSHIVTPSIDQLKKVMGATVNAVHGNDASISALLKQFDVETETMEGAAVALVCENEKIPYLQIRSISNYVTKRNKEAWDIPLAIKNLNEKLEKIISELA